MGIDNIAVLLVAIGSVCVALLIIFIISLAGFNSKKKALENGVKMISHGMTKPDVVRVLGSDFVVSASNDTEILTWTVKIPGLVRELLSKKDDNPTAIVTLKNGAVCEYKSNCR